jgi:small subunit ribosomal protein S1
VLCLQPGDVKRGVVSGVEDFGAFVELVDAPPASGLLHKSELSWDPVLVVDDVLQPGGSRSWSGQGQGETTY